MPPYIEVDSHHNDECTLLQRSSADDTNKNNNLTSPLFHDADDELSTPPTTSRLDRRQSDPGFTGLSSVQVDPMKKPLLDSRVGEVSRIQEIIGPESAYYVRMSSVNNNNYTTSNKLSSTAATTNTTPKPRIVYKNGIPQKKPQNDTTKKKDLLEVQIFRTTKKGCKKVYKILKSISKKCKLSTRKNSKKNKNAV